MSIEAPSAESDMGPSTDAMLTGADYLASLDDGREIWVDGEKVGNVSTHPAFAKAARTIARLYDALHSPDTGPALTTVDRFGNRTSNEECARRSPSSRAESPSATLMG